mmetsp:Transcript_61331/g.138189  ORF Transcript_61331/g.138189 Transcript_61331/m.138189 type:complete len:273 (+) Transcript_61331:3626-4444(+)
MNEFHEWLAQGAINRLARVLGLQLTSLWMEEDSRHGRPQVTALARILHVSVGASPEGVSHCLDVGRRRVRGGEALNQPPADEHGRIVMVEEVVQHGLHLMVHCLLGVRLPLGLQEDGRVAERGVGGRLLPAGNLEVYSPAMPGVVLALDAELLAVRARMEREGCTPMAVIRVQADTPVPRIARAARHLCLDAPLVAPVTRADLHFDSRPIDDHSVFTVLVELAVNLVVGVHSGRVMVVNLYLPITDSARCPVAKRTELGLGKKLSFTWHLVE